MGLRSSPGGPHSTPLWAHANFSLAAQRAGATSVSNPRRIGRCTSSVRSVRTGLARIHSLRSLRLPPLRRPSLIELRGCWCVPAGLAGARRDVRRPHVLRSRGLSAGCRRPPAQGLPPARRGRAAAGSLVEALALLRRQGRLRRPSQPLVPEVVALGQLGQVHVGAPDHDVDKVRLFPLQMPWIILVILQGIEDEVGGPLVQKAGVRERTQSRRREGAAHDIDVARATPHAEGVGVLGVDLVNYSLHCLPVLRGRHGVAAKAEVADVGVDAGHWLGGRGVDHLVCARQVCHDGGQLRVLPLCGLGARAPGEVEALPHDRLHEWDHGCRESASCPGLLCAVVEVLQHTTCPKLAGGLAAEPTLDTRLPTPGLLFEVPLIGRFHLLPILIIARQPVQEQEVSFEVLVVNGARLPRVQGQAVRGPRFPQGAAHGRGVGRGVVEKHRRMPRGISRVLRQR
mmetsp:Transcript_35760/g.85440  ORF Transcript_35760/g.85440 Transcript_35760/m.85440 type:complete len:456 (-) Transcript_35760:514-1881(-)